MHLYLIRHAEAVPLGQNGVKNDADRPLTQDGRSQCQALAEAFNRLEIRLDQLVTSPLVRAHQTASLLLEHLPDPPELLTSDQLAPGRKRRKLSRFLAGLQGEHIGIVGHNPDLSTYLGWLIGCKGALVELAKAGVAHLTFDGPIDKASGTMDWMTTPEWYATPSPSPEPAPAAGATDG